MSNASHARLTISQLHVVGNEPVPPDGTRADAPFDSKARAAATASGKVIPCRRNSTISSVVG